MSELTPMMQQYRQMKEQTDDCILFFRLGDFYEMFDDDALLVSNELDLTLTTRDRAKENPDDRTPMCGVPYHSCEAYIARLISKGHKVALCEQMEEPSKGKGLVKRELVRIVTPGTVTDGLMLPDKRSNYIGAVYFDGTSGGVCFADLSTGEFELASFFDSAPDHIACELGRFAPVELLVNSGASEDRTIMSYSAVISNCLIQTIDARFEFMPAAARLCEQFGAADLDALGVGNDHAAVCAAGALLSYLHDTQKTGLEHISAFSFYTSGKFMDLDVQARRNLELTESMRFNEKRGSLLWVLDHTRTPMGGRLLRSWVERPLLSPVVIGRRQNAVGELADETIVRGELSEALHAVGDMERTMSRIVCGSANCRDMVSLAASAPSLKALVAHLAGVKSAMLRDIGTMDTLDGLCQRISDTIADDPPFSLREGGMIRTGFDPEIDRLRSLSENSRGAIADIEAAERQRSGIKRLKIGYNKVFGYYIEIPRALSEQAPPDYIRKQTLANSERFITEELKRLESELLTAHESLCELEYQAFSRLREEVAAQVIRVQRTASFVAELDVLCSLAEVAVKGGYCRPEVDMSYSISITDGRHPVVELAQPDVPFVPNDTLLDVEDNIASIITGPNMAGKSTYMRQTALIVLMAQIGSFVPAKAAHIGIVDRIFTRIGATDDLSRGQSTFMVEMAEVAGILRAASRRSLIILDEIGRGTSTFDGMAIARAVLEYCTDQKCLCSKTLFATHYHELTALEGQLPGVKNYSIAAKKRGDGIIFLRKIVRGGSDDSYGVEVAKLAGVPDAVIRRAKAVLKDYELAANAAAKGAKVKAREDAAKAQVSLSELAGAAIVERLRALDPNILTPLEALNLLYSLKKEAAQ